MRVWPTITACDIKVQQVTPRSIGAKPCLLLIWQRQFRLLRDMSICQAYARRDSLCRQRVPGWSAPRGHLTGPRVEHLDRFKGSAFKCSNDFPSGNEGSSEADSSTVHTIQMSFTVYLRHGVYRRRKQAKFSQHHADILLYHPPSPVSPEQSLAAHIFQCRKVFCRR